MVVCGGFLSGGGGGLTSGSLSVIRLSDADVSIVSDARLSRLQAERRPMVWNALVSLSCVVD